MITNTRNSNIIYHGSGRRKGAMARVQLIPGSGKMIINRFPAPFYLQFNPAYLIISNSPLQFLGITKEYDVHINTKGGGLKGQTDAIKLGIARALCTISSENRKILKSKGYLTCDTRIKERKKYGLRKARKAPQYSKR
uniref:Ribosomal protein S9 n=1 Tax=Apophlaea sinclairii TaxID=212746 RepID=A0A1C9CBV1_9FLOR|nr:ribosomal protein S9 [Apophlaea sinclairii]AOM65856.1 ribosomal protein S9 [Apophlaea sinclairii]